MESQLKAGMHARQKSLPVVIVDYLWGCFRAVSLSWAIIFALLALQLIHISVPFRIRRHCLTTRTCRPIEWPEETILQIDRRVLAIESSQLYSVNNWQDQLCSNYVQRLHQDDRELILQVTRAALTQYSKDILSYRDFALNARVVPSLTSANHYSPSIRQYYGLKVLSWILAFDLLSHVGFPPNAALSNDLTPDSCWAFSGPRGQLGIDLSERIRVHNITIDHLAQELAADIGQAPRIVVLWGRIDGEQNIKKAREYVNYAANTPLQKTDGAVYLPLLEFGYQPSASSHIQTFGIPDEIRSLHIAHNVIIVQIKKNWGSSQTCLYQVRVHGTLAVADPEHTLVRHRSYEPA
jgi:hypothetical protein